VTKKLFRFLGPVLVLLVFLGAVWLLYHELRHYRLNDIGVRIWEISPLGFAVAVAMTIVNWLILIGYDWIAVRYVGVKLPLRRVAVASFCGYACSYNFGATLAGTTVRLRLYSAWNMPLVKILQLLVILGLTFWFGLFAVAGIVFVVAPPQIVASDDPPAADLKPDLKPEAPAKGIAVGPSLALQASKVPAATPEDQAGQEKVQQVLGRIVRIAANMRMWGVVLLVLAVIYLGLSAARLDSIRLFGHRLPVPPFRLTLFQYAITAADMLVAGVVLYALMYNIPGVQSYLEILGIYLLVYVAVVLSHVPGGYGVFDGGMIFCLRQGSGDLAADRVIAAILVFRAIYYWIPLLLAILLLGVNEVRLRRRARRAEMAASAHQSG
jgi:uncharacterized membrane protein YbhN (UPF0104 family)